MPLLSSTDNPPRISPRRYFFRYGNSGLRRLNMRTELDVILAAPDLRKHYRPPPPALRGSVDTTRRRPECACSQHGHVAFTTATWSQGNLRYFCDWGCFARRSKTVG